MGKTTNLNWLPRISSINSRATKYASIAFPNWKEVLHLPQFRSQGILGVLTWRRVFDVQQFWAPNFVFLETLGNPMIILQLYISTGKRGGLKFKLFCRHSFYLDDGSISSPSFFCNSKLHFVAAFWHIGIFFALMPWDQMKISPNYSGWWFPLFFKMKFHLLGGKIPILVLIFFLNQGNQGLGKRKDQTD